MLNILTPQLKSVTSIDGFESFILTRRYHEPGEFELHVNKYANGAEYLQKKNIVALSQKRSGIIQHRELPLDESGKQSENWLIKGPTMQGIFKNRLTVPPDGIAYDYKNGPGETVMQHYIYNNAITPKDRNRKFIMLRSEADFGRGKHVKWQSRFKNLAEELTEISLASQIGWDVFLDKKNGWWVFDVYEGRDLTDLNSDIQPVTFSIDNDTIKSQSLTDSDLSMSNVGYVGGQGEGELREILELGNYTDLDRHETFIDARDVADEGANGETLTERGQRKLDELKTEFYFEAQIQTPITREFYEMVNKAFLAPYQPDGTLTRTTEQMTPFVYGKDFDLGDIVRLESKQLGIRRTARITEIKEIYERSGFKLELTFGPSRPTILDKFKQEFANLEGVIKR